MFDFDRAIERRGTHSQKWDKYAGKDIIPLWVADMDFVSPPAVMDALHNRVAHGVFGYTHPGKELDDTVVEHLHRTYGWRISPEWLIWLPGLVTGLNVACRSVGSAGSIVWSTVPIYPPFLAAPRFSDRLLSTTRMILSKDRWQMDFDHLKTAMDSQNTLFLLCNPHNPTGRVLSREELLSLAEICLKHDITICSDEIHCDLILESGFRHIPIASLGPEISNRTITLMAPSKTYNLPGLGCSFAVISNPKLRRRFKRAMAGIVPHVNAIGLAAAEAVYTHGKLWLLALLDYLRDNRDLVTETINRIEGLYMAPVQATYLAWIDTRGFELDDPHAFFEEAGVGLSDGREFGSAGFVRLNFGCPRQLLRTALNRMASAVRRLQGRG